MINRFLKIIALITAVVCPLIGGSDKNTVVAEVDGAKITLAQFEQQHPAAFFQAQNTFYETQRKVIEEYFNEYLLDRESQKENLTVSQLLEKHVNATIAKDPSDDALFVYYEGLDTGESFDAVKDKIREHLRERRIAKAKAAYMQTLRSHAKMKVTLNPPRAQVSLENTPVRGNANAQVTFIEYADYECPVCQQIQPDLNKLEAEYKGRIAFAYKDVPLPMHPRAQKAAEAAHCAGVQNKYWEYHDLLLTTKELAVPQLKASARQLKLDGTAFDQCLDSGAQSGLVKAQLGEAQALGIEGTPSFFLNGRFYAGALPFDRLKQAVEEELKASELKLQQSAKR